MESQVGKFILPIQNCRYHSTHCQEVGSMKTKITARFVIGYDGHMTGHLFQWMCGLRRRYDHLSRKPVMPERLTGPLRQEMPSSAPVLSTWMPWAISIMRFWTRIGTPDTARGLEWSEEYFNSDRKEIFSKEEETLRRQVCLRPVDPERRHHRPADCRRIP